MSNLVLRLCQGWHPIEMSLRPERTVSALKECLDRAYVHIKFTNTKGGTELGIPVDREHTDLSTADFDKGMGRLTIVGTIELDYVKVRCIAQVNLQSLDGQGRLELVK